MLNIFAKLRRPDNYITQLVFTVPVDDGDGEYKLGYIIVAIFDQYLAICGKRYKIG